MKRRNFLSNLTVGGLTVGAGSGGWTGNTDRILGRGNKGGKPDVPGKPADPARIIPSDYFKAPAGHTLTRIGSHSLEELLRHFEKELYDDTIPYWGKYGVDPQFGGYLIADKKSGSYPKTDKDLYSQGRILWIFSYLFNHFGKKPFHLEAARQGKEALVKNCLLPDGHWGSLYTRDWKQIKGFFDIYADVYMILGLEEYSKASGDPESRRLAVETCYRVTETILAPQYQGQGHGPFYEPGVKRMGTWAHFLFPITLLLQHTQDEGIERMARMCVRSMLQYHWQRDKGYAFECLDHSYRPYSPDYLSMYANERNWAQYISGWHNIQGAWKTMYEAIRVKNRDMFNDAMRFGFQILEKHLLATGDCRLMEFDNIEKWKKGEGNETRAYSALYDVFLFCLLAVEYTHSPEAADWFEKTFNCVKSKPGGIDGSLTLHEPRGIMFAVQILRRMIDQKGRPSQL